MGIIDAIATGFRLVARRLWLLALPIALDLFLLLGPKLSVQPVMSAALDTYLDAQTTLAPAGSEALNADMIASMRELVNDVIGRTNLFASAAWSGLGFPSVGGSRQIDATIDTVHTITTGGELLAWEAIILGLGLLLVTGFLVLVAQSLRESSASLTALMRHVLGSWLKLLALFVPLGLGLTIGLSILSLLPPSLSVLLMMALFVGVVWAMLYLAFVPQAITLTHANPLAALGSSFGVVRNNLGASLGLLVLVFILRTGFGLIWGSFVVRSQLAGLIAMVGNAYIGTALTVSLFVFYHDRLVRLRQQPAMKGIQL